MPGAANALGTAPAHLALALAADGVKGGVRPPHQVEAIGDDPRAGKLGPDR